MKIVRPFTTKARRPPRLFCIVSCRVGRAHGVMVPFPTRVVQLFLLGMRRIPNGRGGLRGLRGERPHDLGRTITSLSQNWACHPRPIPLGPVMNEGGRRPKICQRPDASLAEVIPTRAPAATSLSQWRLSLIRDQPTAVAIPYRPTVAQGRWISSASEVASAKASALCPDGNDACPEKGEKPSASRLCSGRGRPRLVLPASVARPASASDRARRPPLRVIPGWPAMRPVATRPAVTLA